MKTTHPRLQRRISPSTYALSLWVASLCASLAIPQARAADGTWTLNGSDTWSLSNPTPWASGIVADGADFTAFFQTDITANRTVTLSENLTIGNLLFQDTAASHDWTLAQQNASVLTLQTSSGTPTITVSNRTATISAILAGNQGLTKTGTGVLVLSGNNTFTGTTTVNQGTLRIANSNAVGNVDIASGTLNFDSSSVTFSGNTSGAGQITKSNGASTVTLLGNGTHTGGTSLSAGTMVLGTGTNNGLGTGTFTLGSGTLRSSDNTSRTITNNLSFGSGSITFGAAQDATNNLGDLTFTDTGTRSLGGSPTKNWTVTNSTTVTFNNNFTGNNDWEIRKAGTGTLVFNGSISTSNAVDVIVNAGTLTLNGSSNDYTGSTIVNSGTLLINGAKTSSTAVDVNTGGTLGGTGTISGLTTINAGGTLAPGQSAGLMTFTGDLTLGGDVDLEFDGLTRGVVGGYDAIDVGGILTYGGIMDLTFSSLFADGTSFNLFDFGSFTGDFTNINLFGSYSGTLTNQGGGLWTGTFGSQNVSFTTSDGILQLQAIPEPSAGILLGLGLAGLLARARHRRA